MVAKGGWIPAGFAANVADDHVGGWLVAVAQADVRFETFYRFVFLVGLAN